MPPETLLLPQVPPSSDAHGFEIVRLGPDGALAGTLTVPAGANSPSCAVLLTNVGINPRVGPYRVNVELAQDLARQGIPSLRLDLSGLGESERASGDQSLALQWIEDVRHACDLLQRRFGVDRIAMIGVCSGADVAHQAAQFDPRLGAVVLFDPYLYPTRRTALNGLLYRVYAQGWETTMRLAWRRLMRALNWEQDGSASGPAEDPTMRYGPNVPGLDEFAQRLKRITDRGAQVLLLYSGSFPYYYNYESQARDNLRPYGLATRVQSEFIRNSDHVLMGIAGRRRFIESSVRFVQHWARSGA